MNGPTGFLDTRQTLNELPPLISAKQAAGLLGVSTRHVARLCERGQLRAVRCGRLWRINRTALARQYGLLDD